MERDLNGRVAVITGASSGIGEATARALAARGASVALLARRADRVQSLAEELSSADGGGKALALEADVTDRASLEEAARRVKDELGRVDCLVNNAGVMLLAPFEQGKVDEWKQMIDVNLTGVLETTDVFLEQLTDGGGDIVNISSVAGRKGIPNSGAYNATKWGINGWSDALRQELLGKSVRVIVVEPGAVATELPDHISDEDSKKRIEDMGESFDILAAEDIASVIEYSVSVPERVSLSEILIRPTEQPI
ncbi:MAG: SDR family oxidoreductase [Thermoleophilaceae bacterium]